MKLTIQYAIQADGLPTEADFTAWVMAALPDGSPDELSIRVVDAEESRQLNNTYRGKDRPTNVLSFPFEAPSAIVFDYLGDLAICASVVEQEAIEQRKNLSAHWAHMVVHGVLHLCGHDHQTETMAEAMEMLERNILSRFDFPDPYEHDE